MSLRTAERDVLASTTRAPRWSRRAGQRTTTTALITSVVVVAVAAWELLVRTGVLDKAVIAPPSTVVSALGDLAKESDFWHAFDAFLGMIAVSFLVGTAAAVMIGSLIGMSNFAYRVFHPFVLIWFATPNMVFLPLLVTLFGFGTEMKIVYGAISTMPSVLVTMIAGVRARERRLVEAARSLGASRTQRLFKVVMPDVAPTVFTSAAYGLKHALLGILIVELFSSQLGIGYLITLYTSSSQPGMVYAILLTVAVLATALGLLLSALERRVGRWRTIRKEV